MELVAINRSLVSVTSLHAAPARIVSASTADIAKTKAIEELRGRGIAQAPAVGGAAPTRAGATPTAQSLPTIASVEAMSFQFSATACKGSGDSITCPLLVINRGEARNLTIGARSLFPGSLMIDDACREYPCERKIVGNRTMEATLMSAVPPTVAMSFTGVTPMLTRIALLDLVCRDSKAKELKVLFRQIPVVK